MIRSVTRLSLLSLLVLVMGCVVTSCGDDDEETAGQGARQVAELKALLLDANGQVFFDSMGEGAYKIGLLSKQDAIDLVRLYVGSGFTGQPRMYVLDDNKGTVDVASGGPGVFFSVGFMVEGLPQFRLWLLDEGGNTFTVNHTCPVCGYTWMSTLNRCPRVGNKTYHPQP